MIDVYDGIVDTSRRQILCVLASDAKTVNQIVQETQLKQPNVSNHLNRMKTRGIVKCKKVGRSVYYSVSSHEIQALVNAVVSLRNPPQNSVDFGPLRERLLDAMVTGDEDAASLVLDEAFRAKTPLLDIYQELLAPTMRQVGKGCLANRLDASQEHMASEITLRLMASAVKVPGPPRKIGKTCVVGCIPNDHHVIGPRMASDYLRLSGWRSLFCGANVPIRSFLSTVYQNKPDLALIGCSIYEGYDMAEELVKGLRSLQVNQPRFAIGLGGNVHPSQEARFLRAGVDFICRDMKHFAQEIVPELERV